MKAQQNAQHAAKRTNKALIVQVDDIPADGLPVYQKSKRYSCLSLS